MAGTALPPGTPTGVISDSYDTRSGERVWIIQWKSQPPFNVSGPDPFRQEDELDLKIGSRVARVNGRIELLA